MLEQVLYEYLTDTLSVPVYMERPAEPDSSFVVIERTGGSETDHIRSANIAVQSIAPSLYEAVTLNEEVITAMLNAVSLSEIGGVRLADYYNFTSRDQSARHEYRYQSIFKVSHY